MSNNEQRNEQRPRLLSDVLADLPPIPMSPGEGNGASSSAAAFVAPAPRANPDAAAPPADADDDEPQLLAQTMEYVKFIHRFNKQDKEKQAGAAYKLAKAMPKTVRRMIKETELTSGSGEELDSEEKRIVRQVVAQAAAAEGAVAAAAAAGAAAAAAGAGGASGSDENTDKQEKNFEIFQKLSLAAEALTQVLNREAAEPVAMPEDVQTMLAKFKAEKVTEKQALDNMQSYKQTSETADKLSLYARYLMWMQLCVLRYENAKAYFAVIDEVLKIAEKTAAHYVSGLPKVCSEYPGLLATGHIVSGNVVIKEKPTILSVLSIETDEKRLEMFGSGPNVPTLEAIKLLRETLSKETVGYPRVLSFDRFKVLIKRKAARPKRRRAGEDSILDTEATCSADNDADTIVDNAIVASRSSRRTRSRQQV